MDFPGVLRAAIFSIAASAIYSTHKRADVKKKNTSDGVGGNIMCICTLFDFNVMITVYIIIIIATRV